MSQWIRSWAKLAVIVSLGLMSIPAWAVDEEPMAAPETPAELSLYDRLGGEPAVTAVVDDFVNTAAGDPAVNFTRVGKKRTWDPTPENVTLLKKHLTQFVCSVAGGPQTYEGKDMATAHKDLEITDEEFNAIAVDLQGSLTKFSVPEKEQGELLAAVETTRGSIVESAETPTS